MKRYLDKSMSDKKKKGNKSKKERLKNLTLEDLLKREGDKPLTKEDKEKQNKELEKLGNQIKNKLNHTSFLNKIGISQNSINLALANAVKEKEKADAIINKVVEDYNINNKQLISLVEKNEKMVLNLTSSISNQAIPKFYKKRLDQINNSDYSELLLNDFHKIMNVDMNYINNSTRLINEQYKNLLEDIPNQLESLGISQIQNDLSKFTIAINDTSPLNYLSSNQLLDSALIDIEKLTSLALYDYENKLRELTSSFNFPSIQEYNDFIENQLFTKKYLETKVLKKERKEVPQLSEITKQNTDITEDIQKHIHELQNHESELVANENLKKINDFIKHLKTKPETKDNYDLSRIGNRIRKYRHHDLYIEILEHLTIPLGEYPKNVFKEVQLEIKKEYEKKLKNTRYPKPHNLYQEPKYRNSIILTHTSKEAFYWDKNANESDVTKLTTEPKGTHVLWTTLKQTLSNKKNVFLKEIINNHNKSLS